MLIQAVTSLSVSLVHAGAGGMLVFCVLKNVFASRHAAGMVQSARCTESGAEIESRKICQREVVSHKGSRN